MAKEKIEELSPDVEDIDQDEVEDVLDEDAVPDLEDEIEDVDLETDFVEDEVFDEEETAAEEFDADADGDDADDDDADEETTEALEELESEELELLDEEAGDALLVDEVEELRAIRREELTMNVDAQLQRSDEFVCQSCFMVKRTSQLANRKKMLCADCAY
ncbi:MAG: DUF4193 family protein [Acidimicrobiia bacterium]